VSPHVAVGLPECGVVPLVETNAGHIDGAAVASAVAHDLEGADAVLIGPGLDDIDEAAALLQAVDVAGASVILDAYALGALSREPALGDGFTGPLILTPNTDEAALLLGRDLDDLASDCLELAGALDAVVSCHGIIAEPGGQVWRIGTGASGLGTSGSGDVLSGAVAGFCARGVEPAHAAVWASYAHAVAGDRLAVQVGPLGYLAGELLGELPRVLVEVGMHA
jgi:ADP-dependent NAD(P)H-hydrate dehydratase